MGRVSNFSLFPYASCFCCFFCFQPPSKIVSPRTIALILNDSHATLVVLKKNHQPHFILFHQLSFHCFRSQFNKKGTQFILNGHNFNSPTSSKHIFLNCHMFLLPTSSSRMTPLHVTLYFNTCTFPLMKMRISLNLYISSENNKI